MSRVKTDSWKILTMMLALALALTRTIYISEPDILWQTKSGMDTLNGEPLLRPDTYSWSAAGETYLSNSWLWNSTLGVVYRMWGFYGISFLTGILVLGVLTGIIYLLRRRSIPWMATFFTVAFVGLACNPWLSGRPQILDYLFIVIAMVLLERISIRSFKSHILIFSVMTLIIAIWNNFHLTGAVGAPLFAALYFLRQTSGLSIRESLTLPLARSVLLGVLLIAVCILTPFGIKGLTKPFTTVSTSTGVVTEWLSPWLFQDNVQTGGAIVVAFMIFVFVMLYRRKGYFSAVFLLGMMVISSIQVRWIPFLVLVSVIWIAQLLNILGNMVKEKYRVYVKTVAFAISLVVVVFGSLTFIPQDRVSGAPYGYDLVSQLPRGCKLFSTPSLAGPVIFARPDVKVSVDGRNDLYGDRYIEQNRISYGIDDAEQWLDKNGVNCILLDAELPLTQLLEQSSQWKLEATNSRDVKLWLRK